MDNIPRHITVLGAHTHNLKHIDVNVPLHMITAIAGVSGSGKSSLALGILYAEGSRRYLEALSTYTRRRMTQAPKAQVDGILHIPAALALHQRPGVPGMRSTFGTGSELLNSLRLMFSRLASHRCPNGHYAPPSLAVAAEQPIVCPVCGEKFFGPCAEDLSFNGQGACPACSGTGIVRIVDKSTLVPDESLTLEQGAVLPWRTLMWSLMVDVCRAMGVRTDVPFRDLSPKEKDIVYNGPAIKKHILYRPKNSDHATELDFTYYNAVYSVQNALNRARDEKGIKRVEKFLKEDICPVCNGSRLSDAARAPRLKGIGLDKACELSLGELDAWVAGIPDTLPEEMRAMAKNIGESFANTALRLIQLGLGYLALERAASTLSTGERQRMQLARVVRNRATGVLYVLDEPSIGLHPHNLEGVAGIMDDLVADGNSIILVDHDPRLLRHADWIIELGPGAGAAGGRVIAQGTVNQIETDQQSLIGPWLRKKSLPHLRPQVSRNEMFAKGVIHLETEALHTVKPLKVDIPRGRLIVVAGVSGSGKTTLILESLVPALAAATGGAKPPNHIKNISAPGIKRVRLIDATPIGINVRSTVATYSDVHDALRKIFAKTPDAIKKGYKAGDFSYNTGRLRCPVCDGCGVISLDVQFLPDVNITCPECRGSRYAPEANLVHYDAGGGKLYTLPEIMAMNAHEALGISARWKTVNEKLQILEILGIGYLSLGEDTPGLSGGEAQRLKLASEMGRGQEDSVFVFDEPTTGLHPLDVEDLLRVFETLIEHGATVVVIEHDLFFIQNADYVIDMGPGGGKAGGEIVAIGTPAEVAANPKSVTGRFLRED